MIIKKKLIFLLAVLLIIIPLCNAAGYGSGAYGKEVYSSSVVTLYCGDGTCNNGETCSSCSGDCGACPVAPSTGGGGGSSCTYDWQCTSWSPEECPVTELQERICINRGTCKGTQELPQQKQNCEYIHKEPLFDIFLTLSEKYKEICSGNEINAKVKLENYGKVELLDAFMTYEIIDENNSLISELKDTRAITSEKEFEIILKIPESTPEGNYRIYAQINYGTNKTAVAGESFRISSNVECSSFSLKGFNWNYLIYPIILIFGLLLIWRVFKLVKKILGARHLKIRSNSEYRSKIKENLRKIKAKHFVFMLAGFILTGLLFITGTNMTGFITKNIFIDGINWSFFGVILFVVIFGLFMFIYRMKIIEKIKDKTIKHPKNRLKSLINKKVYLESGNYLGKIEDIILGPNKIESLKIKLDKKLKHEAKGIIIGFNNVKNIGDVVLILDNLLEHSKN